MGYPLILLSGTKIYDLHPASKFLRSTPFGMLVYSILTKQLSSPSVVVITTSECEAQSLNFHVKLIDLSWTICLNSPVIRPSNIRYSPPSLASTLHGALVYYIISLFIKIMSIHWVK